MTDFIQAVLQYQFLMNAVLGSIFTAVISGTLGTYITINRFSYIAGAIAHSILGGMGLFSFLNSKTGIGFFQPINGAILSALLFGFIIGFLVNSKTERIDTVLSSIWSIGMSVGVIFIFLTPGYNQELMRYLFGNILLVSRSEIILLISLDIFLILLFILFYNKIFALGFDPEFLSLRGVNIKTFNIALILIIAVSTVMMVQIVGVVLLIAMLTLPSAISLRFTNNQKKIMIFSFMTAALASIVGLYTSYQYNIPTGPVIIIILGILYLLSKLKTIKKLKTVK